jgi:predicted RNA-binding Zn ribbon-like protein
VRDLFEAVAADERPDAATLAGINAVLRRGEHVVEPDGHGGYQAAFRARTGGVDEVLLPVALSAGELLTEADRERIHQCANERCILLFHDTTKSGTRRWCSTGCMNRARSIARYRERKGREQAV